MGLFKDIATDKRQNKQIELTARAQGLEPDGQGGFTPTKLTQQTDELKQTQNQAAIDAIASQQQAQQSRFNSDDMMSITDSIANNDWDGAKKKLKKNKDLSEKLKGPSLDTHDINPINFDMDMHLFKDTGFGFENVDLNDPEIRNALSSSYFKATGGDGKERLMSTSNVFASTNQWADMDAKQRDAYTARVQHINSVLKGSGITTAGERQFAAEEALKGTQTSGAQTGATQQVADIENFFAANPDATYADFQATQQVPKSETASVSALNYAKAKYYLGEGKRAAGSGDGAAAKLIATYDREHPEATPDERITFVDKVMEKSVAGSSSVKEKGEVEDLNSLQKKAQAFAVNYDDDQARQTENSILRTVDPTRKKSVEADRTTMEGNFNTFNAIDRVTDEYSKGDFKVDKDAVANVQTYLSKIFGNDVPQELSNANFNTASGMILAQYMKDISGTAVGVKEAERLSNIFQGGDLADETFVLASMRKFSDELREKNKLLGETNQQYIPQSVNRFSPKKFDIKTASRDEKIAELKRRQGN